MTKKTSMRCAAWNTVITMLLLGVWVEVRRWRWRRWRVWVVEVGGEEERERRELKGRKRWYVCKIYFVTNNKVNK